MIKNTKLKDFGKEKITLVTLRSLTAKEQDVRIIKIFLTFFVLLNGVIIFMLAYHFQNLNLLETMTIETIDEKTFKKIGM